MKHSNPSPQEAGGIKVGDKVRSFDFECHDLTGPRAAYVEGTVVALTEKEGCPRYELKVERDVFRGEEPAGDHSRVGETVFPPVNGTPSWLGGVTDFVVPVVDLNRQPPHFYEQQAAMAEEAGDYARAYRALQSASAVSIGHNRSARYEAHAEQLARDHGVDPKVTGAYFTDADVRAVL